MLKQGLEAIKVLNKNPDINLILCDWNMPVMTGLEFLVRLRKDEQFKHIPFLMVTARK